MRLNRFPENESISSLHAVDVWRYDFASSPLFLLNTLPILFIIENFLLVTTPKNFFRASALE
jgi:hypothetical protein